MIKYALDESSANVDEFYMQIKLDEGKRLAWEGNPDRAIGCFLLAAELSKIAHLGYYYMGLQFIMLGMFEDALKHFDMALKYKPSYAEVLDRRCFALYNRVCEGTASPDRTDEDIMDLLKNFRIKWDGTYNPVENSPDKEERKALYGRKKRPARTTTIACNDDDYTIYKDRSHPGSTYDITALREEDPDLGRITKSMKDPNTPKQDRVNAFLDGGYQKAEEEYPGASMHIVKKKPKNGQLTDAEKAHNKWISKRRNGVECAIVHHKNWRVLKNWWTSTAEEFDDIYDVVTGLSNLKVALNNPRYKRGW